MYSVLEALLAVPYLSHQTIASRDFNQNSRVMHMIVVNSVSSVYVNMYFPQARLPSKYSETLLEVLNSKLQSIKNESGSCRIVKYRNKEEFFTSSMSVGQEKKRGYKFYYHF